MHPIDVPDDDPWPARLAALTGTTRPSAGVPERIGGGVEGEVYRLCAGRVAKVWRSRTVAELAPMRRCYADVDAARPAVLTPLVEDLLEVDGVAVTLERELPGTALQDRLDRSADRLPEWAVDAVVACLEALRTVPAGDGLRALPVVGETAPFRTPGDTFADALAALLERRAAAAGPHLAAVVPDLDERCAALQKALGALGPVPDTALHGDLFGANIHVDEAGRAVAMLDFGFMTTAGDPRFDAGVTASIMDMYGPHAERVTAQLTGELAARLGDDPAVLVLYRAAYALATCTLFGTDLDDGHFRWAVARLTEPVTTEVLGL